MTNLKVPHWVLVVFCCFCFFSNTANAEPTSATGSEQTTSDNVIKWENWDGAVYGNDPGGCCSSISGSGAMIDQNTQTIMFSYGRDILAQTIAINQALGQSGISLDGLQYGWTWRRIGNSGRDGDRLHFVVEVKDSSGNLVERYEYNRSDGTGYGATDEWTTEQFVEMFGQSYQDPSSASIAIIGQDGGYWGGYYGPEVKDVNLRFIYRANPCAADPLYDPSCDGYAEAYAEQQYDNNCAADPTYDSGCPGYYAAWEQKQCNADPLYSPSCSGYQQAYYDQQCSIDPLYDSGCPGYQQAYFDQQCNSDPFYDTSCPGYQSAFYDQQCAANPLYDSGCSGYASAYYDQQCSVDPLYDSGCPGYETAYYNNQCSMNPLYDSGCNGYADAFFSYQCELNPLYNNQCPLYASAYYDQQCGIDSLYDSGCAGYEEAYFTKYIKPELDKQAERAAGVSDESDSTNVNVAKTETAGYVDPVIQATAPSQTGDAAVDKVLRETTTISPVTVSPVELVQLEREQGSEETNSEPSRDVGEPVDSRGDDVQERSEQQEDRGSEDGSEGGTESRESTGNEPTEKQKEDSKREKVKQILVAKAKDLANQQSNAATIEQQQAIQQQVLAVLAYVYGFDSYSGKGIAGGVYPDSDFYQATAVPETRTGLRNGLAQQILHDKMVDMQYK